MSTTHVDIAILGAGAAGLMAAISAGRGTPEETRIVALDGAKKIGAKILVAGGGRCNVTHDVVRPADYAGGSRNAVKKVLKTFTVAQTIDFFASLGVELKREDTGKLFPVTDQAQTVLNALKGAVRDAGAEIHAEHRVTGIAKTDDGFLISTSQGDLTASRVIFATGGKALPRTGSDGLGYELLKSLGHTVTHTTPALVPLILPKKHWLTMLSGITLDMELSLANASGKVLHRQEGSALLTHFGLSGPAVMDISRHWIAAHEASPDCKLTANLLPGETFESIEQFFMNAKPTGALGTTLRKLLPERLADALLADVIAIDPKTKLAEFPRDKRRALAHALTALPLPVIGDRGYTFAEVTAGGVPLDEIELATMSSRVCPGLYLCGEVLNVDGRIGGYNFQWAWCTGRLAGQAAADGVPS